MLQQAHWIAGPDRLTYFLLCIDEMLPKIMLDYQEGTKPGGYLCSSLRINQKHQPLRQEAELPPSAVAGVLKDKVFLQEI